MANITISQYIHTQPLWDFGGLTCTLKIFYNRQFVTSDSDIITRGSYTAPHFELTCTISGTDIIIPQFTLDSTTDGSPKVSSITGAFFDSTGRERIAFFKRYKVPHTRNPLTWPELFLFNTENVVALPNTYYTKEDINTLLAELVLAGAGITDGDKGDITVSGSGATWTIENGSVTLSKIADASNDARLLGSGDSGSGSPYSEITLGSNLSMSGTTLNASGGGSSPESLLTNTTTLDNLITTANANPTETYDALLTADVSLTSTKTIPENVFIRIVNGNKFIDGGGGNLVFEGPGIIGDPLFQIFSGFAAGEVRWTNNYPEWFRPEWWGAVGDNSNDDLVAFNSTISAMKKPTLHVFTATGAGGHVKLGSQKQYYLSDTWRIDKPVKVSGNTGGDRYTVNSILWFDQGVMGLELSSGSNPDGTFLNNRSAQFSTLEEFGIFGKAGTPADNCVVDYSGLTFTLKNTGTFQEASIVGNNSGSIAAMAPGSTITVNGYSYVVSRDMYIGDGVTGDTDIPVEPPRFWCIADGTDTIRTQLGQITEEPNDWIGGSIKVNGVTYTILDVNYPPANGDAGNRPHVVVDSTVPANANSFAQVLSLGTGTNVSARLNIYHGINPKVMMRLQGVHIYNFCGNGINMNSNQRPNVLGEVNNNLTRIENVSIEFMKGAGILLFGVNSQPMQLDSINVEECASWGIYEEGSSGITIIAPHASQNYQGAYRLGGLAAGNVLIMPYVEGGQPPSIQGQYTMALGGINYLVDPNEGYRTLLRAAEGALTTEGILSSHRFGNKYYQGTFNPTATKFALGSHAGPNTLFSFGAGDEDINIIAGGTNDYVVFPAYGFGYSQFKTGWYSLYFGGNYATDQNASVFAISGSEATEGGGQLWLKQGFYIGTDGSRSKITNSGSGIVLLRNDGLTDFNRLQLGGTTSSFPSLKRNGDALEARLSDDSASTNLIVAPETYGVSWDNSMEVPTKNDVYDKIETIGAGGGSVATDTIFDAKGDLAVGTAADTASKLTVGTNDTFLIADSGQATGIKWAGGATARTALGLGTIAVQNDSNVSITGGTIDGVIGDSNIFTNNTGTFLNTGLKLFDVAATKTVTFKINETIAANRTLNIVTGDADRTLTFSGNATISGTTSGTNTGDQYTSTTASKLIGRRSGSAGAAEEITLGTNLSMSGTTLNASGGGGGITIDDATNVAIAMAVALG